MKIEGPFEVTLGPRSEIVCVWCKKHVPLRNAQEGVLYLQICIRPICEATRPRNHKWQGFQ